MGYSDNEASVRVDFFKKDAVGRPYKWYLTEAVVWHHYKAETLILDAFAAALCAHLRSRGPSGDVMVRLSDMVAICLEPHHEHAHPIIMAVSDALDFVKNDRRLAVCVCDGISHRESCPHYEIPR